MFAPMKAESPGGDGAGCRRTPRATRRKARVWPEPFTPDNTVSPGETEVEATKQAF